MGDVILLIDEGFEDAEAVYPYYRMQEAGYIVTVVGEPAGLYHSKHGYPLKAEKKPNEVDPGKYSILIIPGGTAPDRMRTKAGIVKLVRDAVKKGLVVGAICHGAQVLIEADVLRGVRATCYVSVKTDLINAGASYEDSPVVVDGRFVTSRHPGDLPHFCREILRLAGKG